MKSFTLAALLVTLALPLAAHAEGSMGAEDLEASRAVTRAYASGWQRTEPAADARAATSEERKSPDARHAAPTRN